MISYSSSDIVTTQLPVIIHGVNMAGKMNSGVAKSVRESFPEAYDVYINGIGTSSLGSFLVARSNDKIIGNLITQRNYGYDKKIYASPLAIRDSLENFCWYLRNISSLLDPVVGPVASPKIGCGLGGLDWDTVVEPIFHAVSEYHNIDFVIYDNGVKS